MAFILTEQLFDEATGDEAFARYRAYLDSVRGQLPPGAYALATSDWYFDGSDHRAPHDAWLTAATVEESATGGEEPRRVAITLRLLGAYHDGHIELRYRDVTRYQLDLAPGGVDGGRG